MLRSLNIRHLGPSENLDFQFGNRLNFLTGDNGLGKSFVLDIIWWTLTGTWPQKGHPIRPDENSEDQARIDWLRTEANEEFDLCSPQFGNFSSKANRWITHPYREGEATTDSLVVYCRMDGGFSMHFSPSGKRGRPKAPIHLTASSVWDGLTSGANSKCEGFYRDVTSWLQSDVPQRKMLQEVARVLSPDSEPLQFAAPRRVYLDDTRTHPILKLPYGEVPVSECSAGIRRILSLAYVLTWACHEDAERSRIAKIPGAGSITVIIDEIEAHLHPLWQRTIVPTLLNALEVLRPTWRRQFHISTHAPLVLASSEPLWVEDDDRLFHFKLHDKNAIVEPITWAPHGTSSYWLTSPIFGLGEARSREAERAIRAAKDYMMDRREGLPEDLRSKHQIHQALKNSLPGQDPFWPRWMFKTGLEE